MKISQKIKTDVELEQDETGARSNKLVIPLKKRSTQQKYCKSSELQFEIHMKNIGKITVYWNNQLMF